MDLVVKWQEVIENPLLQNLPFKIELNKFGQILMSPISNAKGTLKFQVAKKLDKIRQNGIVAFSSSILTFEGVRVADVAWASEAFIAEFGYKTPYPKSPEICVEIKSPANSKAEMEEKVRLYLEKGVQEVWIVSEKGKVNFYTHTGQIKASKIVKGFKL
jgi:Uma2 family endonuclease